MNRPKRISDFRRNPARRIQNPARLIHRTRAMSEAIEQLYARFFDLTREPLAASNLTLAAVIAAQQQEKPLTAKQAAERLAVSVDCIYDACERGQLAHRRVGRAIRIRPSDLEAYKPQAAEPIKLRRLIP